MNFGAYYGPGFIAPVCAVVLFWPPSLSDMTRRTRRCCVTNHEECYPEQLHADQQSAIHDLETTVKCWWSGVFFRH